MIGIGRRKFGSTVNIVIHVSFVTFKIKMHAFNKLLICNICNTGDQLGITKKEAGIKRIISYPACGELMNVYILPFTA